MPFSILPELSSWFSDRSSAAQLDQVKTGDRLMARIVKMLPSGRTVLQFPGFRAVSAKPMGGQVGDIVHFEVLPDTENNAAQPAINRAFVGKTLPLPNPGQGPTGIRFTRPLRLNALPDTAPRSAPDKAAEALQPQPGAPMASASLPSGSPETASLKSFQIISKWFHRLKKDRPATGKMKTLASSAREGQGGARETSALRSPRPHGFLEPERTDRAAGEAPSAIDISSLLLGQRPVRMSVYDGNSGSRAAIPQPLMKAVFLLDLEATGAVRTDLKMSADNIDVCFFVESQAVRDCLARALPDLKTALSTHTANCFCQVVVSRQKILAFLQEGDERQDNAGVAVTV
jgi:hypothetical protein